MSTDLEKFVAEFRTQQKTLAERSHELEENAARSETALSHLVAAAAALETVTRELAHAQLALRAESKSKRKSSPPKSGETGAKKAVTVSELKDFLEAARAENLQATPRELSDRVRDLCKEAKRELSSAKDRKLEKLVRETGDFSVPQLVEGVSP